MNKKVIISALKEKEERLDKELQDSPLYRELLEVRKEIISFNSTYFPESDSSLPLEVVKDINTEEEYNPMFSHINKIKFVLGKANRGLTNGEICGRIIELEPSLDRYKLMKSMSATLFDYSVNKKRVIKRIENKLGDLVYSLI